MIHLTAYEYHGTPVPFADDAYVNLTAMCRKFEKRPAKFLELPSTQAFIAALAADTGLPDRIEVRKSDFDHAALLVTFQGGDQKSERARTKVGKSDFDFLPGTWAHPDLALECARWLSPAFAIWCNRIVRGVLSGRAYAVAADRPEIKKMETSIERTRAELVLKTDQYWNARHIGGHVSVSAFLRAAGVRLNWKSANAHLSSRCRYHCIYYRTPIGAAEQCRDGTEKPRSGRHGWTEVATYPPAVIAEELADMGQRFEMPSVEALQEAHTALSRPRSGRLLTLPAPYRAEPASSLDFGHGSEV